MTDDGRHRKEMFKCKGDLGNRKKVVQTWLDRQKATKRDLTMHARKISSISEIDNDGLKPPITLTSISSNMEEDHIETPQSQLRYQNQLMVPYPLEKLPESPSEWFVRPCPKGERCLVLCRRGKSFAYRMDGSLLYRFQCSLPSGSKQTRAGSTYCIFDCIADEESKTYFVLDMMVWKGFLYYDCTADFRFFFMMQKINETTAGEISTFNRYPFKSLPYFESNDDGISAALSTNPHSLLFYHKDGFYYFEEPTPLVCQITTQDFLISTNNKISPIVSF
jgi:snurportin-1